MNQKTATSKLLHRWCMHIYRIWKKIEWSSHRWTPFVLQYFLTVMPCWSDHLEQSARQCDFCSISFDLPSVSENISLPGLISWHYHQSLLNHSPTFSESWNYFITWTILNIYDWLITHCLIMSVVINIQTDWQEWRLETIMLQSMFVMCTWINQVTDLLYTAHTAESMQ